VSIWVSCDEQDAQRATLRFVVTDSGPGIAEPELNSIFDPFAQMRSSTTRRGGTGLGLPIARRLVGLMGGKIGAKSVEGEGSIFWFTVVLDRQEAAEEAPEPVGVLADKRVLVVDESVMSRVWLTMVLKSMGCRPEEAPGAGAALKALGDAAGERKPFQLVLVDLRPTGTDDLALAEVIDKEPALERPDMVLMVPLGRLQEIARLERPEIKACVSKPIKRSRIVEILGELYGAKRRRSTSFARIDLRSARARRSDVRILVAEDSVTDQRVALGMLQRLGFQAEVVNNGLEALEALKAGSYDLVLMDCQMPDLDGYQTTRAIRSPDSKFRNPDIPVVAMTAHAMEGDRDKCLAAGMNDYLTKPVDTHDMLEAIQRCLTRKRK
jgi:CheY-like chemotaxis protein